MKNQKQWEQEVRDVFDKIKQHDVEYTINISGKDITIFPNVFSPAYFTDSEWFADTLPNIVGNGSLLEIGTGTGLVALFCALNGADVTATDINLDAIKNAQCNFGKHHALVDTYVGDMFEPVKGKKFDFIFWNHPFNFGDRDNEEILLQAGFDFQYKSLEKYFDQSRDYLSEKGILLLGTGNFARLDKVEEIAQKNNFEMQLINKIDIPLAADSTIDNDYRIYKFVDKV